MGKRLSGDTRHCSTCRRIVWHDRQRCGNQAVYTCSRCGAHLYYDWAADKAVLRAKYARRGCS